MDWSRSNSIGLARAACVYCGGAGTRTVRRDKETPCCCVLRGIFRVCYNRFRECVELGAHTSTVSWDHLGGKDGRRSYSRKKEEYAADFCLVSRRLLNDSVVNVGQVHHLNDPKAPRFQIPPQDVLKHKRAEVSYVRKVVHRRTAGIRANLSGYQRNKWLGLARHRVVKPDFRHLGSFTDSQG